MSHTPGPYSVFVNAKPPFNWRVAGKDRVQIAENLLRENAERIAYCLNIVEESEKTDSRETGASR